MQAAVAAADAPRNGEGGGALAAGKDLGRGLGV